MVGRPESFQVGGKSLVLNFYPTIKRNNVNEEKVFNSFFLIYLELKLSIQTSSFFKFQI